MHNNKKRSYKYLVSVVFSITLYCSSAIAHIPSDATKCVSDAIEYQGKMNEQESTNSKFTGDNVHGFVEFVSDVVVQGISRTQRYPGFLGGVLYIDNSGLYTGLIAVSNSFVKGGATLIPTIGYMKQINDNFGYQLSVDYRSFPGYKTPQDISTIEYISKVNYSYNLLKVFFALGYSPDFNAQGQGWHPHGGIAVSLTDQLRIESNIGHQSTKNKPKGNWFKNFSYWDSGIALDIMRGLTIKGVYSDSSLSKEDCYGQNICSARFVLSLKKSF